MVTDVYYSEWALEEALPFPGTIFLSRPKDGYELEVRITKAGLNEAIPERAFVLEPPKGMDVDQRDAYPGINAVTLLEIKGDDDSLTLKKRLVPVVRFAVEQRLAGTQPDYWDHATMLELAVLNDEPERAMDHLADALAVMRETWEAGSTANNLRMIERARTAREADTSWLGQVIQELESRTAK